MGSILYNVKGFVICKYFALIFKLLLKFYIDLSTSIIQVRL